MPKSLNSSLLFALMLAVFLDLGSFFMPMPVYTPLFLHSAFIQGYSHNIRAILLGLLIACYGLAQLFGGPIFGELSDQRGRKKTLLIALSLSAVGSLLSAISLSLHSIILIYVSRLLIGFSSGTIAIVFALAADYSSDEDRAKNLGYINIGISLGASLGPIIGGYLADNPVLSYFGYATPFYFMTLLYLVNIIVLFKLLPIDGGLRQGKKIHILTGIQNIRLAINRSGKLKNLVLMALFFQIGIESFYLAAPVLSIKVFQMTSSMIANHFLLLGGISVIATWWVNKSLSKHFSSSKIYFFSLVLLIASFIFMFKLNSHLLFWIPFAGVGLFGTLCWVHTNTLFSQSVDKTEQGMIFGVSQSLWSVGGIVGAVLVGLTASIHYEFSGVIPIIFEILSLVVIILMLRSTTYSRIQRG